MPTTTLSGRCRKLLPALAVTLTLGLAGGCGGPDSEADPTDPATSSGSTGPASASASGSASPSADPATGKTVETSWFRVRVPAGWRVTEVKKDFLVAADDRSGPSIVYFQMVDTFGEPTPLRKLAQTLIRTSNLTGQPQVATDATLGGEPAYLITGGRLEGSLDATVYGALHDDHDVSVSFALDDTVGPHQELVDSVLATWQWK